MTLPACSTARCRAGSTTTDASTSPGCSTSSAGSTPTWCTGPARNTNGCATRSAVQWPGWPRSPDDLPACSHTGASAHVPTAGRWEPDESRGSRPVLREPGGANPPATHLIALCHSREQTDQVKARLAEWLIPRGLSFNQDKTQITHLDQGVDFLGFTIRRYPNGKLLTKPSNNALRRIRRRLSAEMKALRGANADAVIAKINPIITGWAAYYRIGASKHAFGALDAHLWRLAYKWARFSHPNKSTRWVLARYFGMFNRARRDKWVFGSRETGFYLRKFAWTPIVRHRMVTGTASPDDPALTDYWSLRRRRNPPPIGTTRLRLLRVQHSRCPICHGLLLHADQEPQSPREW